MNPDPLTYRELLWMAEGRAKSAWAHTAAVIADIRNFSLARPEGRWFTAAEINPFTVTPDDAIDMPAKEALAAFGNSLLRRN